MYLGLQLMIISFWLFCLVYKMSENGGKLCQFLSKPEKIHVSNLELDHFDSFFLTELLKQIHWLSEKVISYLIISN